MEIKQYDVKSAYLYGTLKETVYMEQPEGFVKDKNKVCKLKGAYMDYHRRDTDWNAKINEVLESIGMSRVPEDPCLYTMKKGNKKLWLGLYVDDILVVGSDVRMITETMDGVKKHFELTESQELKFLNIRVTRRDGKIELTQAEYVDSILHKFNLTTVRRRTPRWTPQQDLDADEESSLGDQELYQEMLGSIMYLATGTRIDIAFSVSRLSQYSKDPKQVHVTALKRVFRYLKGTRDYKLVYGGSSSRVSIGTDASWCTTRDAKSFGGYLAKIGENVVGWSSRKQGLVALSTCESELIAINEGVQESLWIKGILGSLEPDRKDQPIVLNTDSKSGNGLGE